MICLDHHDLDSSDDSSNCSINSTYCNFLSQRSVTQRENVLKLIKLQNHFIWTNLMVQRFHTTFERRKEKKSLKNLKTTRLDCDLSWGSKTSVHHLFLDVKSIEKKFKLVSRIIFLAPKKTCMDDSLECWHVLCSLTIVWIPQIKIYSFDFDHFSLDHRRIIFRRVLRGRNLIQHKKSASTHENRGHSKHATVVSVSRNSFFCCCLLCLRLVFFWWNVPQCSSSSLLGSCFSQQKTKNVSREFSFFSDFTFHTSQKKSLKFIFHIVYYSSSSVCGRIQEISSTKNGTKANIRMNAKCLHQWTVSRLKNIIKISCLHEWEDDDDVEREFKRTEEGWLTYKMILSFMNSLATPVNYPPTDRLWR